MTDVNWELIIFIIILGLIAFAGLGLFIGMRISSDKRRIRELESELSEAKREMEVYRSQVNSHFKKTSELFNQMTDSYKAVYMHMAEGVQTLCNNDAVLLKAANVEFLALDHEEARQTPEVRVPGQEQTLSEPVQAGRPVGQLEEKENETPDAEETLQTGDQGHVPPQEVPSEKGHDEQPDTVAKAEEKKNQGQRNQDSGTEGTATTQ